MGQNKHYHTINVLNFLLGGKKCVHEICMSFALLPVIKQNLSNGKKKTHTLKMLLAYVS